MWIRCGGSERSREADNVHRISIHHCRRFGPREFSFTRLLHLFLALPTYDGARDVNCKCEVDDLFVPVLT